MKGNYIFFISTIQQRITDPLPVKNVSVLINHNKLLYIKFESPTKFSKKKKKKRGDGGGGGGGLTGPQL